MCMFKAPSTPRTSPAPAYTAPVVPPIAPAPPPPPPPPPPPAPVPYYAQQEAEAAASNERTNNGVSRAKVGRAALKINLVNSGSDSSGSGVNTTN